MPYLVWQFCPNVTMAVIFLLGMEGVIFFLFFYPTKVPPATFRCFLGNIQILEYTNLVLYLLMPWISFTLQVVCCRSKPMTLIMWVTHSAFSQEHTCRFAAVEKPGFVFPKRFLFHVLIYESVRITVQRESPSPTAFSQVHLGPKQRTEMASALNWLCALFSFL